MGTPDNHHQNRNHLIKSEVEKEIYQFMRNEFVELECPVRIINGMPDHIHILYLLSPKHSLSSVVKQVKGSVSHWINKNEIIPEKFSWQTGYAAYGVCESVKENVYRYIRGQKQPHKVKTFQEEYQLFEKLYRKANSSG